MTLNDFDGLNGHFYVTISPLPTAME